MTFRVETAGNGRVILQQTRHEQSNTPLFKQDCTASRLIGTIPLMSLTSDQGLARIIHACDLFLLFAPQVNNVIFDPSSMSIQVKLSYNSRPQT